MTVFPLRLSGPVSRDTARLSQRCAPIARYGVWGFGCLNMANWAQYPLQNYESESESESEIRGEVSIWTAKDHLSNEYQYESESKQMFFQGMNFTLISVSTVFLEA